MFFFLDYDLSFLKLFVQQNVLQNISPHSDFHIWHMTSTGVKVELGGL